ncbi:MAG: bamA 2 [Acidobacteria bacterium]|nr:bamA 2 [Acidobacteriota bacterium]
MIAAALLALTLATIQDPPPPNQPPPGSPPLVRTIEIAFPTQGNLSVVDPQTYLYYIHTRSSRPSEQVWTPYDVQAAIDDFQRLWNTGFLDNLWIDVADVPYDNGVVGKHITFNLEERQRVKIVDYTGSKAIDTAKIDEKLKEANADIRLDSFIDSRLIRKVEGLIRDLLLEKGFQSASVGHSIAAMPGGPKLVHLTFTMDEGPRVKIRAITFAGNQTVSDRTLRAQLKINRARPWWRPSFVGGTSTYQETGFDQDADQIQQYYRDHGYVTASVGVPELRPVGDSPDGKTRWVDLHVPVTEGHKYRVGTFTLAGNTSVKSEALRPLFVMQEGEYYSEKRIRKGLEKAREIYGAGGYYEFTGFPDVTPRDQRTAAVPDPPDALKATETAPGPAIVDVTMRLQEGHQYFVNRLTFTGNTMTHDSVIRRAVALVEGGVFNTEALKYSVRRLNQLGYFKPIEDQKGIKVEKTPGVEDHVDVTLKVEEQNRNSVNFGAGVSQYEGLFGNLSYTTANLFGRGESLSLSVQKGSRSNVYQVGLTEPYLFNRPISASAEVYSRKIDYFSANTSTFSTQAAVAYSEVRQGSTWSLGRQLARFMRGDLNYTYEVIDVAISNDLLATNAATVTAGTPLFNPYLDSGRHIDSRIAPSFSYNTVDNPIMSHSGMRINANVQLASVKLGGSYDYVKPELEAVFFIPTSKRTGFGLRGNAGMLHTFGSTTALPYYLRYFLGGETQIRGVDIRTVGPLDDANRALGGNKFLLFNAEYYVDLFPSVRLLAFHDAGQAFDESHPFNLRDLRTSSGGELRVFIPMLNIPFRLIYFVNIYRDTFQPYRGFKFAVGTTF